MFSNSMSALSACNIFGATGSSTLLIGGNIQGSTDTLATAVLLTISQGRYDYAIAYGTILLGIIFLLAGGLTFIQYAGSPSRALTTARRA